MCRHIYYSQNTIISLGKDFWRMSVKSRVVFSLILKSTANLAVLHSSTAVYKVQLHVSLLPSLQSSETLDIAQVVGLTFVLFFFGALLETKCYCVRAAEAGGEVGKNNCFLFGLSEAADLLEGNRCSQLLPVTVQPANEHRHRRVLPLSWLLSWGQSSQLRGGGFSVPLLYVVGTYTHVHGTKLCVAIPVHIK